MALYCLFFASVVFLPATRGDNARYRPDRVILLPKKGVQLNRVLGLHAARGHRLLKTYDWLGGLQIVQLAPGESIGDAVEHYRASGLVEMAEPDYKLHAFVLPNDPEFLNGTQWSLRNTGLSGGNIGADIHAPDGWDTMHDASNIVVAVIDSGIRYTHQDLADNIWTNTAEIPDNGIDDDNNGIVDDIHGLNAITDGGDPMDDDGHGSHVAGIIGAVGNNGLGTAGVAWKVQLMACKFLDDAGNGDTSDAIQCIDYARKMKAQIINASWGGTEYSAGLLTAISAARNDGIIFVTAAGNDAQNLDFFSTYPAAFNLDNMITVCATSRYDTFDSGYSNYSPTKVHVGAPGTLIYSTWDSSDTAYSYESGTSMASPCVAGICALMKARFPDYNHRQIIDRLLNTVDPLPSLAGKCSTGGRVNLLKALGSNPESIFTLSTNAGAPPLTVAFTNISYGDVTNLVWDFGDGSASEASANPTHLFQFPGKFKAKLTVTGSNGRTSSSEQQIVVAPNYTLASETFNWIDPTQMAVVSTGANGMVEQTLPFTFVYYGEPQSSIFVGANGILGFNSAGMTNTTVAPLPAATLPNAIICPYWDNLDPTSGGTIYFGTHGSAPNRQIIISWVDVPRASSTTGVPLTFQAILEENAGDILFQYLEVHPENLRGGGKRASVGIENSTGTIGVSYSYSGAPNVLSNSTAIRFTPKAFPFLAVFENDPLQFLSTVGLSSSSTRSLTLYNPGNVPVAWGLRSTAPWIKASATNGTLAVGEILNVTLSLENLIQTLLPGEYSGDLTIENLTDGAGGAALPLTLAVSTVQLSLLQISAAPIAFAGKKGGSFAPVSFPIGVTNTGNAASLTWRGVLDVPWATLTPASGTLAAGTGTNVVLTLGAEAESLDAGVYHQQVKFENLVNGQGDTSVDYMLTVLTSPPMASIENGQFTGILTVPEEGTYVIDFSDDLQTWTEIDSVGSQDGQVSFSEPAVDAPVQFYRARKL